LISLRAIWTLCSAVNQAKNKLFRVIFSPQNPFGLSRSVSHASEGQTNLNTKRIIYVRSALFKVTVDGTEKNVMTITSFGTKSFHHNNRVVALGHLCSLRTFIGEPKGIDRKDAEQGLDRHHQQCTEEYGAYST
jgi:hypothetical protein